MGAQAGRQFVRIPNRNGLRCDEVSTGEAIPDGVDARHGVSSGRGILFESPRRFRIGSLLKLEMNLRATPSPSGSMAVLARVVGIAALPRGPGYEIGAVLVGIDPARHEAIIRLMAESVT